MIKNRFKNSLIKDFRQSFSAFSKNENFLFIGKSTPWSNENLPDPEIDSFDFEIRTWNDMLALKKILPEEVALCIRKILWTSNTVYNQYDDVVDLYSETTPVDFYVMTDDENIYKCISNNNGSQSLYAPTGTSVDLIITADGYIWKYMYSIRPEMEDFITNDFIPVEFLDRLIYEESDLRNEQLAVELDAKFNGGKISNIIITQVGSPYLGAIDYEPYPSEIEAPEDLHFVRYYSTGFDSGLGKTMGFVGLNKKLTEVSNIDNFYTGNYIIYISTGPGAGEVRNIISYDGTTGILATDSPFSVNLTGLSTYKILPKVLLVGDGTNASCISVLNNETNKIKEIKILNPGKNYKTVTAEVLTTKTDIKEKTILRVIKTPLYTHGAEAAEELGCKNAIIRSVFDSRDNQKLKFFNDYRQVGIIQNPKIIGRVPVQEKLVLDIESFSATQDLNLNFIGSTPAPFTNPTSLIGKTITQGITEGAEQVVGVIKQYNSLQKALRVSSIQGKFKINSADPSFGNKLYLKDYDNEDYYDLSTTRITNTFTANHYDNNTFIKNTKILTDQTYTTATIDSWSPNLDGISGKLTVRDIKGAFKVTSYDISGNLVPGERFTTVLIDTSTTTFVKSGNAGKSGIVSGILQTIPDEQSTVFRTTATIEVSKSFGVTESFGNETFIRDRVVKQIDSLTGVTLAVGTVVDWTININDPTKGTLLINVSEGQFIVSTDRNLYQFGTEDFYSIEETIVCSVISSEAQKYTGNMIYINNILPIRHGTDSLEEIKIIIGF
jgi:hypothetical protein